MKAFIFSIGAAVMVATAGPAFAADLPSFKSAPVYAPPPPAFTWTGFYLDAGAGYGEWNANTTTRYAGTGICELCTNQIQGGHGFLGRAGAGFDYQFADQFVAGVFGDGTYSEMRGSLQDQTPGWTANTNQNWSWAAGGRLGWLMTPNVLLYGDAGFSQARFTGGSLLNADGSGTGNSTQGFTANGWFAGGGFETMLAPGWFWRTEFALPITVGTTSSTTGYAGRGDDIHFHPYVQTVTSSLVYKFGWPGFSAPRDPVLHPDYRRLRPGTGGDKLDWCLCRRGHWLRVVERKYDDARSGHERMRSMRQSTPGRQWHLRHRWLGL